MSDQDVLKRRLEREIKARKQAEQILEEKALELYQSNEQLKSLNQSLEETVEKRTRELAESQKQFKSLVESAGDIIYNADARGFFTYVNPIAEELLGYRKEELLGRHYTELVRSDKAEAVRAFYLQMLKEKKETSYYEFPVVCKDGAELWLGQRVQIAFKKDESHKITAVARDISALVEVRNALEASEKKYRGIINSMELGLLEVSREGIVIKAYDWFCDMTGYTAEELVGKDPIPILMHPDEVEVMHQQDANRKRGQAGVYEVRIRKKNGTYMWVAISGAPFYDPKGRMIGSIGIHLDITHQKKLQEQLEQAREEAENARQAEKEFLAHMSHEIRTPLNAVVGMTNLLASTELSSSQKDYVQDIKYAADVLHGLISDVLDISKIEAGEVEMLESELHLEQTIAMLCKTLDYRAREKRNTLSYTISPAVPSIIQADRNFLNQILLNLLGNALKFTENGTISIDVEVAGKIKEGLLLKFTVSDTGIGIGPEKIDTIFERFKQEKAETRKIYGGTGLGLAICRHLVELHGGTIYVDSEEGKGSQFIFSLKVRAVTTTDSGQSLGELTHILKAPSTLKLLVAEDNELNQKYISALLKQWGVAHHLADNGQEAVQQSLKHLYDLILMDMQMPVMNGYEAAHAIREDAENPNQQTKILALTASALIDEKKKARQAGMDDHLTKPFTPDQLLTFLSQNLGSDQLPLQEETSTAENLNSFQGMALPPKIDKEALYSFYVDDLDYAREMTAFYLKIIDDEVLKAQDHLQKNNYEEAVSWVHRMSSNFFMVGLPHISKTLRRLETELKSQQTLENKVEEIQGILEEVKQTKKDIQLLQNQIIKVLKHD
ncbi:MAG: PAS domain S-box protein [Owenweeksia sp.]